MFHRYLRRDRAGDSVAIPPYSLAGPLRRIAPPLIGVGLGAVAWALYVWSARPWYAVGDDAYYADVARHIAEGKGAATSAVYLPVYLSVAPPTTSVELNPLIQPVGYPALLGLAFRLFGASELVGIALQGLLMLVVLVLTYLIARRLLEPIYAALVVAIVGAEPKLLQESAVMGNDLLFMVLILAALATVLIPAAKDPRALLATGVILALAQLVRANALALLPAYGAVVCVMSSSGDGIRRLLLLVGATVPLAAVLVLLTGGHGYGGPWTAVLLLSETSDYPGWSAGLTLSMPSLGEVFTTHLSSVTAKVVAGIRYYAQTIPNLGNPLIVGGVVLAALQLVRSPDARPLLLFAALGTALTIALAATAEFATRLLIFILPVYVILVVAALRHTPLRPRWVVLVLAGLALWGYGGEILRLQRDAAERARYVSEVRSLVEHVDADARGASWIASDVPSLLAWHIRLPAVLLPAEPSELEALERVRRPIDLLVITSIKTDPSRRVFPTRSWRDVLEGKVMPGYAAIDRIAGTSVSALILRASD